MRIDVVLDLGKVPKLNNEVQDQGGVSVNDVVGHEIYSHALPYSLGHPCSDLNGCAADRENEIRSELGEPPRTFGP